MFNVYHSIRTSPGSDTASQRGVPVGANSCAEPTEYDITEKVLFVCVCMCVFVCEICGYLLLYCSVHV